MWAAATATVKGEERTYEDGVADGETPESYTSSDLWSFWHKVVEETEYKPCLDAVPLADPRIRVARENVGRRAMREVEEVMRTRRDECRARLRVDVVKKNEELDATAAAIVMPKR